VNEKKPAALSPGGHQSVHRVHAYPMYFLCPAKLIIGGETSSGYEWGSLNRMQLFLVHLSFYFITTILLFIESS